MAELTGREIVLGVTGGIAAYKACALASMLTKAGANVRVVMTKGAEAFVTPLTFEALTHFPVADEMFERARPFEIQHVSLAKKADLIVIAPATADAMAKIACGIADELLFATVLATSAPVLLAPAMNTGMWRASATRDNVEKLRARGFLFVGPDEGNLACGDTGAGRMSEPEAIFDEIARLFERKCDLVGVRVLVTAGPTREKIDPVRYLTNRSSGRMGYALAQEALDRGAEVTLVSGPTVIAPPSGAQVVRIDSTDDLHKQMVKLCPSQDIVIQAAAPADFTPVTSSARKIKKTGSLMTLTFRETVDVAMAVGEKKKPGQFFCGFAAETERGPDNARRKLKTKNLDMIVLNDVLKPGVGFDGDTNQATLITAQGEEETPLIQKRALAKLIFDRIADMRKA